MGHQFFACSRDNSDGIYRYYHFLKLKIDIIDIGSKVGVYEPNIRYFRKLIAYLKGSNLDETIIANGLKSALIINILNLILKNKFNILYINHGLRYKQKFWFRPVYYILEIVVNFFSSKIIFINKKEFNSVKKNKKFCLLMHPIKSQVEKIEKKFDFIFIGRNDRNKRPHLFLEYVSQFVGCSAVMVGSDDFELSQSDNRVKLVIIPNLENRALQKYIGEAKFVVSTSEYETSPVIAIEAHEMGTIFVSNRYKNDNYPMEELKTSFTFTDKKSFRELIELINGDYNFFLNEQSQVIKNNHLYIDLWCEQIIKKI